MTKERETRTNNNLQNTTQKTKDRATQTPLETEGELRCSGRVSSSCSTSGSHRVTIVSNSIKSHEWRKDRETFKTGGTYPWSCVIQIFVSLLI